MDLRRLSLEIVYQKYSNFRVFLGFLQERKNLPEETLKCLEGKLKHMEKFFESCEKGEGLYGCDFKRLFEEISGREDSKNYANVFLPASDGKDVSYYLNNFHRAEKRDSSSIEILKKLFDRILNNVQSQISEEGRGYRFVA